MVKLVHFSAKPAKFSTCEKQQLDDTICTVMDQVCQKKRVSGASLFSCHLALPFTGIFSSYNSVHVVAFEESAQS